MNKASVEAFAEQYRRLYGENLQPIFEILLFTKTGEDDLVLPNGKKSGFPDTGSEARMGYYNDLDAAIDAMHTNAADIQECCYRAGFVLCRFPGLYRDVGKEARIYFRWDAERKGFFEAEEPRLFGIIAM